jgi:predicted dehydrogenase/nucleoside-diphosphate-sugar epimerase
MGIGNAGKLRVAIAGAGYVAEHHVAALRALDFVEIVGICDLNVEAARTLAARHRIAQASGTLAELAPLQPQAVYVLTPPASHAALALDAFGMGCHVFVEKPMAESLAECDALIEKARERGLVLSVNHSDRFDPVVLRALELARSGRFGDVLSVDVLRSSEYAPYAGGPLPALVAQGSYPFRDLGVHALYVIEQFVGAVRHVDAGYRATGRDPNVRFDEWHATTDCTNGTGRMLLSWNARPMESRLVVRCTRGTIEADRFLQICRVQRVLPGPKFIGILVGAFLNAAMDLVRVPWSVFRFATGMLKPSPGIRASAQAFARAVHEGRAPPVDPAEGRRAVALMEPVCARADAERTREIEARFAPLPPAEVLVTGAAGFLGRRVVHALANKGMQVRVLVRDAARAGVFPPNTQVVVGDLGDPRAVDHAITGTPLVFHVGAAMRGGPREFEAGTTWGTRNVVDSCVRRHVKRLVYVSSLSVLDHAGRDPAQAVTETSAYEPHPTWRGAYTQTKLVAEQAVLEAVRAHGLPAVIVRPGQIFGPGAEKVTPNGTIALAGRWIAVGDATQTLPLVFVDDVVDALLMAALSPDAPGHVFNVVDPATVTQGEYLERVRARLGPSLRVIRVPTGVFMWLAWGVELLGKVLKRDVPLTRYRVRSLRPLANFDLAAAHQRLAWRPRIGLREGLDRTFGPAPTRAPRDGAAAD